MLSSPIKQKLVCQPSVNRRVQGRNSTTEKIKSCACSKIYHLLLTLSRLHILVILITGVNYEPETGILLQSILTAYHIQIPCVQALV